MRSISKLFRELTKKQKKILFRILAAALFIVLSEAVEEKSRILQIVFFVISYVIIGYDILIRAFKGIRKGHPFDENFLMAVATLGAIGLGDLEEGTAVMLFYQIGELFESIAVGKSRKNITELIDIRPDYANIEMPDGNTERVDPEEISVGSVIVVKPGEKVPIDGIVIDGESSIDTAALTGESRLLEVGKDMSVLSGSINLTGVLKLRTVRDFGESTASKILDLVENASSSKSKSEDFISRFARIYTPAVCFSALALAVLPPLLFVMLGKNPAWGTWIYRSLTFLVISCPCALVISIPMAFFGGLGGAGNAGILIKGSNYMEPLSQAKIAVFDKTGTMTKGVFEVRGVHHSPIEDEMLIELAAHAECYSSHPISISILRKYAKEPDKSRVSDVHEISGEGVTAVVDGKQVACGNSKLMERIGVNYIDCRSHGTVVHVAISGVYYGHILIADAIKPNAAKAVSALKENGISKTVMLTGDTKSTADSVAAEIGVSEVFSELLPADKVKIVADLLGECGKKKKLIFVGDGINDAPVLARADVGIAMGGIGSDAAIEAADVVIMDDDPLKVVKAVKIAKKCLRIVYENIWCAIGIKIVCLLLSAFGLGSMWMAIFADTGVMILAVLNSIRALNVKKL